MKSNDEFVTFVCCTEYRYIQKVICTLRPKWYYVSNIFLLHINEYTFTDILSVCFCKCMTVCLYSGHSTVRLQQSFTDWVRSLCCSSMLACVTLVTVGVTLVTNSSFIHSLYLPKKRGYCKCDSVSPYHPTLSEHPSTPVTCPSFPHSSIHLPLSPTQRPTRCACLWVQTPPYSERNLMFLLFVPLYLYFRCVGGSNEHSLSPCLAKKAKPSLLCCALCLSAMLVFSFFFFVSGYRDVWVPLAAPKNPTRAHHSKTSQVRVSGNERGTDCFLSGLPYATYSRSSAARALWLRLEQTMAASSLPGFVLCCTLSLSSASLISVNRRPHDPRRTRICSSITLLYCIRQ